MEDIPIPEAPDKSTKPPVLARSNSPPKQCFFKCLKEKFNLHLQSVRRLSLSKLKDEEFCRTIHKELRIRRRKDIGEFGITLLSNIKEQSWRKLCLARKYHMTRLKSIRIILGGPIFVARLDPSMIKGLSQFLHSYLYGPKSLDIEIDGSLERIDNTTLLELANLFKLKGHNIQHIKIHFKSIIFKDIKTGLKKFCGELGSGLKELNVNFDSCECNPDDVIEGLSRTLRRSNHDLKIINIKTFISRLAHTAERQEPIQGPNTSSLNMLGNTLKRGFSELQELNLEFTRPGFGFLHTGETEVHLNDLIDGVCCLANLVKLNLQLDSRHTNWETEFNSIAKLFQGKLPKLKSLNFDEVLSSVSKRALKVLSQSLFQATSDIERLSLNFGVDETPDEVEETNGDFMKDFGKAISQAFRSLKKLELNLFWNLAEDEFRDFIAYLSEMKNLKDFTLHFNSAKYVGDMTLGYIAQGLKKGVSNLKHLAIYLPQESSITNDGVRDLALALHDPIYSNLKTLKFQFGRTENNIDSGLIFFFDIIGKSLPNLKFLDFSFNESEVSYALLRSLWKSMEYLSKSLEALVFRFDCEELDLIKIEILNRILNLDFNELKQFGIEFRGLDKIPEEGLTSLWKLNDTSMNKLECLLIDFGICLMNIPPGTIKALCIELKKLKKLKWLSLKLERVENLTQAEIYEDLTRDNRELECCVDYQSLFGSNPYP